MAAYIVSSNAIQEIQKNLKYDFKEAPILCTALGEGNKVDPSAGLPLRYGDQQILEMIGDAWLRFVVLCKLYDMKEHTDGSAKSFNSATTWLVSNDTVLPEIGKRLGLEKCLRNITDKKKYLANYTEAILGAVVVDDRNLHRSFQIVERLWAPYINTYRSDDDNCHTRPHFVSLEHNEETTTQDVSPRDLLNQNKSTIDSAIKVVDCHEVSDSTLPKTESNLSNDNTDNQDINDNLHRIHPKNAESELQQSTQAHPSNNENETEFASVTLIPTWKFSEDRAEHKMDANLHNLFRNYCHNFTIFQRIVSQVADINYRHGNAKETILMKLITSDRLSISDKLQRVEYLLKCGASWDVKNSQSHSALTICRKNPVLMQHLEQASLIPKEVKTLTPSINKTENDIQCTDNILKVQSNNTESESKHSTQMHLSNDNKITPLVLSFKNLRNCPGDRSKRKMDANIHILFSSYCSNFETFQRMVPQIADINHRHGINKETILMKVITTDRLSVSDKLQRIKYLLKYGASWSVKNSQSHTALTLCQRNNPVLMQYLQQAELITDKIQIPTASIDKTKHDIQWTDSLLEVQSKESTQKHVSNNRSDTIFQPIENANTINYNAAIDERSEDQSEEETIANMHKLFSSYCNNFTTFKRMVSQVADINYRYGNNKETVLMKIITTDKLDIKDKLQRIKFLLTCGALWSIENSQYQNVLSICKEEKPSLIPHLKHAGLITNEMQPRAIAQPSIIPFTIQDRCDKQLRHMQCRLIVKMNGDNSYVSNEEENINSLFFNHCNGFSNFKQAVIQAKNINCKSNNNEGDTILIMILKCQRLPNEKKLERIRFLLACGASWKAKNKCDMDAINIGLTHCPELINMLVANGCLNHQLLQIYHYQFDTDHSNHDITKDAKFYNETVSLNSNDKMHNHVKDNDPNIIDFKCHQDINNFKNFISTLQDLNHTDTTGNHTILSIILESLILQDEDKIERIKMLVTNGASWYATNKFGINAIDIALNACPQLLARLIRQNLVKQDKLFEGKMKERINLLSSKSESQTEKGSNILRNEQSVNLLHPKDHLGEKLFTHYCKSMDQFKEMVNKVRNINCRNDGKIGNTILMVVLLNKTLDKHSKLERLKFLLASSASWYATNNCGNNAIDIGLQTCPDLLAELIEQDLVEERSYFRCEPNPAVVNQDNNKVAVSEDQSGNSDSDINTNLALGSHPSHCDTLLTVSYCNNIDEFKNAIGKIANINSRSSGRSGDTILMTILQIKRLDEQSKIERIKILVSLKASWYATNKLNKNAIDLCLQKYPHLLAKLIKMNLVKQDSVYESIIRERAAMINSVIKSCNKDTVSNHARKVLNSISINNNNGSINNEIVKLSSNGDTQSEIMFTCYCGSMNQFKDMVKKIDDLNYRNSGKIGNNLLMTILQSKKLDKNSKIDRIKELVSCGASWYSFNYLGKNAIDISLQSCPNLLADLIEQDLVKYDKSYRNINQQAVDVNATSAPILKFRI